MDTETIHDLTAAYALDALDADEARAYEEHLRSCPRCRDELATLTDASAALAFGAPAAEPPRGLRERIVSAARAERPPNVVPLRPRWVYPVGAAAAVAAAAVVAVGIWAINLSRDLDRERAALRIVGDPTTHRYGTRLATVYVGRDGKTALVERLPRAESGKTYEAWVIRGGSTRPAAVFDGRSTVVLLRVRVRAGDSVAVSVEPHGGSKQPTTTPLFTTQT
jgi:anti-sigma-K factor RskA